MLSFSMADSEDHNQSKFDASKIRVLNFVEAVCSRPNLYTINGTLPEILTAICTYDMGIRSVTKETPEFAFDRSARETMNWLQAEFHNDYDKNLIARFGSAEAAIEAIISFASQFRR